MYEVEIDGSIVSVAGRLARFTGSEASLEWPIHLPPTHQILQTAARPATSRCKVQGQKTNCVSWSPLYGIGMDLSLVCIILHRVYVKVYK